MSRIAVFPGSFDPITRGHEDIVNRALPLFDKIIVAIGVNSAKQTMFTLEQRKNWIRSTFSHTDKVVVKDYQGLTTEFCLREKAGFILRGVRDSGDFRFERPIAQMNRKLAENIETVFLITAPEFAPYSSTIVRDIFRNGGDVSRFVPANLDIHAEN